MQKIKQAILKLPRIHRETCDFADHLDLVDRVAVLMILKKLSIQKKGGKARAKKYTKEQLSTMGKKGGRPKKNKLP